MKSALKEPRTKDELTTEGSNSAGLQNPVLTNRNSIRRPNREGEQAHLCNVRNQQSLLGRCCRNRRKEYVLTWGDLGLHVMETEKSAEPIVVGGLEP